MLLDVCSQVHSRISTNLIRLQNVSVSFRLSLGQSDDYWTDMRLYTDPRMFHQVFFFLRQTLVSGSCEPHGFQMMITEILYNH